MDARNILGSLEMDPIRSTVHLAPVRALDACVCHKTAYCCRNSIEEAHNERIQEELFSLECEKCVKFGVRFTALFGALELAQLALSAFNGANT